MFLQLQCFEVDVGEQPVAAVDVHVDGASVTVVAVASYDVAVAVVVVVMMVADAMMELVEEQQARPVVSVEVEQRRQ